MSLYYENIISLALLALIPIWAQGAPLAAKWSQPVDATLPVGQISQTNPQTVPTPATSDTKAADDWKCPDGTPITVVRWWGDYHQYLPDQSGSVEPPALLPTSFILRQYANKAADPADPASFEKPDGNPIAEVEIPLAKCNQTFVQTVGDTPPYIHIFSYQATLDTPWAQTKDSIYWLSVQAKFDVNPQEQVPIPFMNWEWLNTPPADFLGSGLILWNAAPDWAKVTYGPAPFPYADKVYDFAFEFNPLDITVTPDVIRADQLERVTITVNVPPIGQNFAVYVIVQLPNGQVQSFVPALQAPAPAKGVQDLNIPCLPVRGYDELARGSATTVAQGANVRIFDNDVRLPLGAYLLKCGFFNPTQPIRSENDAFLLSSVEVEVQQ
jgi:hypothetical protein